MNDSTVRVAALALTGFISPTSYFSFMLRQEK